MKDNGEKDKLANGDLFMYDSSSRAPIFKDGYQAARRLLGIAVRYPGYQEFTFELDSNNQLPNTCSSPPQILSTDANNIP